MYILTIFFSHKYFPKSQKGFGFWTFLKMSKKWMTQKFLKNTQKSRCDLNAHTHFFDFVKNETIFFSFDSASFFVSL